MKSKKRALYALGILFFLGVSLLLFIIAADEQSVLSSGLPAADRMSLAEFIAKGSGRNQHIELTDFYFGKPYLVAAGVCAFAYRRFGGKSEDVEMELHLTPPEAASGKEFHVSVPGRTGVITVNVPAGAQDGARLRLRGMGRLGKNGKSKGDLYIRLRVG